MSHQKRLKNKSAGVETMVRLMTEKSASPMNLCENFTAKKLKQMFDLSNYNSFEVSVIYHDGRLETISDEDEIGDRIVTCKEILIFPNGESATLDLTQYETVDKCKCEPYKWFYELPEEIRQRSVISNDIACLSYCLGKEWKNIMLYLGLSKGQIEIAEEDYKTESSSFNAPTELLSKWVQLNGRKGTLQLLIDSLKIFEKICPGSIEWENIRLIVSKNENV
ncbi:hypothetical protein Btru_070456 [Bulinus truncatus]|nr:hypothetical protein Btru_070456 [Bulinus truncatus]